MANQFADWNKFRVKNEKYTDAFETLCFHIFCRTFQVTGLTKNHNNPGIETDPVLVDDQYVGFQSKFFDGNISYPNIKESIAKAKKYYESKIDKIIIYLNKDGTKNSKDNIISEARDKFNISIEFKTCSFFENVLSQTGYHDLYQFYFSPADITNFIKSNITSEVYTSLQSSSFIDLTLENGTKKIKCTILCGEINNKPVLITGSPGSGKTMVINKFFQIMSGFNDLNEKYSSPLEHANKPIPMVIRLKDCYSDSLETLIRNRQNDYSVGSQKDIKFIYLLDGLDELTEEKAIQCINYIKQLGNIANTSSIIVSCRISSINKIHIYSHLENIQEYTISKLTELEIKFYFKNHYGGIKASSLEQVSNSNLVSEITDILLLTLFWEHIENLDPNSTAMELFKLKIYSFQKDKKLIRDLGDLNLPSPKWEHIIKINQQISYEFHGRFQFRLPHDTLYQLISNMYPKADYNSINNILHFLAHSFFDDTSESSNKSYIYQHRIYQEYFFAQKLQIKYENNPQILRSLNIFSNYEFFDKFFLPYLRNDYERNKNLIGLLELNLIDVYLGKNRNWGADEPYYEGLLSFMEALSLQRDSIFNQLWSSEGLNIQNLVYINIKLLESKLNEFQQNPLNYTLEQELTKVYETRLGTLLKLGQLLHINNKIKESELIKNNWIEIYQIYDKHLQIFEKANHGSKLNNPLSSRYESYIYYLLLIARNNLMEILDDHIRMNINSSHPEEHNHKLLAYFYEPCIKYRLEELIDIIDKLDNFEFIGLLEVISEIEYLNTLASNSKLKEKIYARIKSLPVNEEKPSVSTLFIMSLLGVELPLKIKQSRKKDAEEIRKSVHNDWQISQHAINYAQLFFISKINYDHYLTGLDIIAYLLLDYIKLINENKSILQILRNHLTHVSESSTQEKLSPNTRAYISTLWAAILSFSKEPISNKKNVKEILFKRSEIEIDPWVLCMNMQEFDKEVFKTVINSNDLSFFEIVEQNQQGKTNIPKGTLISIYDEVDKFFDLSKLFVHCNSDKSLEYFLQGMNNSILRHGSRKDHIVCSNLVEALNIVWRNYLYPQDKLYEYTKDIYNLIKRVVTLTERTSYGPGNLISIVAQYDLNLAEDLYEDLEIFFQPSYYLTSAFIEIQKVKIDLGTDLSKIWEENYPLDDQHYEVFVHILKSNFYTNMEKKPIFNQLYSYLEKPKAHDSGVLTELLEDQKFIEIYTLLCKTFDKSFNLISDAQNNDTYKPTPKEIINLPEKLDTKEQIAEIYKKLSNHAILSKQDDWERLIDKTYDTHNSIDLIVELFEQMRYPSGEYFAGSAGKYYHYAIAYALQKAETNLQMFEYLSRHSGHEGLLQLMKAYEVNQDFKSCTKIFEKFLGLCHLLVDTQTEQLNFAKN